MTHPEIPPGPAAETFESQLRVMVAVTTRLDESVRRLEALTSSLEMRLHRAETALSVARPTAPHRRPVDLARQHLPQLLAGLVASIIAVAIVVYIFSGGISE
ncbi:hypothetical protein KOI35_46910 [Actinoplanes bogorensis]|uniref:Uncharacterized protein n=1 Tax=Paractinoplanes bogorensis TaxID=1610840 RepID=A0ABS5Z5Y3_9ACTN|nr:hypothetical protein [Actinoplanes bogorensis]MBU2671053.1 hypothetical protein [Actinoplanes bogorensis]